ncbi:MAG: hypothetical protein KatS3mg010_1889 [Acidimicrobiia bacterium]|nr:MAG: hypothetical protein KatS3mg010_1889 [Acidimicrobiia bacterium]
MNRSVGRAFAPKGEFDETCTKRRAPTRRERSSSSCVPPTLTSKSSRVARRGWMTAAAWNTLAAPTPSNSSSTAAGVADVADDGDDPLVEHRETGALALVAHEAAELLAARLPEQRAHEVLAEPTRGPG